MCIFYVIYYHKSYLNSIIQIYIYDVLATLNPLDPFSINKSNKINICITSYNIQNLN